MPRAVLALDVGGANLKAAHSDGPAALHPFELWKDPAGLADALHELLRTLPGFDLLAVTMTGELCDCFETKRQGVHAILDAVGAVAGRASVRVWQTDGRLVGVAAARNDPLRAAAANWLALATFAGRYAPHGSGLLIDVGSTTSDVVPLLNGRPVPRGRTDGERLRSRELVYTGVRRTPVCALLGAEGAAELFATTLDVYVVLGDVPEDDGDRGTADGRPATRAAAHARLARMLGGDRETCAAYETRELALRLRQRQQLLLREAVAGLAATLPAPPATVVLAGSGEFLGRAALDALPTPLRVISLAEEMGPAVSHSACAYALMVLACEHADGR